MIRRLRRRMTLMVIAVLILVSSGIVLAISLANSHSIAAQAEETLAVLTENAGAGENRTLRPDGIMDPHGGRMNRDRRGFRGEPPEIRSGRDAAVAGLNNSYTISLNADGSVASWSSDRSGLYTDEQVAVIAESILADGRNSGRIGTQFYRKTEQNGQTLLTVLDAGEDLCYVFWRDTFCYIATKNVDLLPVHDGSFSSGIVSMNGKTSGTAKVTVRAGTNKKSVKVTEWTIGTPIAIAGKDGSYYLAEGKGRRGWIHEQYVTLEGADTDGQTVDQGE